MNLIMVWLLVKDFLSIIIKEPKKEKENAVMINDYRIFHRLIVSGI